MLVPGTEAVKQHCWRCHWRLATCDVLLSLFQQIEG